ncbi:hypothetical protein CFI09_26420 (plasmid) [Escherichia coli]|nr:hypothetical protein CFI09_26420 [Escherichia coli]
MPVQYIWQWRTFVFVYPVVMFNRLSTCQPAFPHQSSCQPPACINATLAQHLTECPATGCATT